MRVLTEQLSAMNDQVMLLTALLESGLEMVEAPPTPTASNSPALNGDANQHAPHRQVPLPLSDEEATSSEDEKLAKSQESDNSKREGVRLVGDLTQSDTFDLRARGTTKEKESEQKSEAAEVDEDDPETIRQKRLLRFSSTTL